MYSKYNSRPNNFQLPGPKEQALIVERHCFLLRNLKRVGRPAQNTRISLNAKVWELGVLQNIRTRDVTNSEHDPAIKKTVRIAVILREICEDLNSITGMQMHVIIKITLVFMLVLRF